MARETITRRINAKALELLEQHKEGLRWSELLSLIQESDLSLHSKNRERLHLETGRALPGQGLQAQERYVQTDEVYGW